MQTLWRASHGNRVWLRWPANAQLLVIVTRACTALPRPRMRRSGERWLVQSNSPKFQTMGAPAHSNLEFLSVERKCLLLHIITPLDQAQETVLLHLPCAA